MTRTEKITIGGLFAGTWFFLFAALYHVAWLIPAYYNLAKAMLALGQMFGVTPEGGEAIGN